MGGDTATPRARRTCPGVAVQPPLVRRVPLAEVLFYGSLIIWIASELSIRSRHPGGTGAEADHGSRVRLLVLIVVGIVAAFNLVSVPHTRLDGWWPVGLVVAGIALRRWSVATLGRFFTTTVEIQPDHQVIETGPYALVRHPSYLGGLLSVVGIGLGLGDWATGRVSSAAPPLAPQRSSNASRSRRSPFAKR